MHRYSKARRAGEELRSWQTQLLLHRLRCPQAKNLHDSKKPSSTETWDHRYTIISGVIKDNHQHNRPDTKLHQKTRCIPPLRAFLTAATMTWLSVACAQPTLRGGVLYWDIFIFMYFRHTKLNKSQRNWRIFLYIISMHFPHVSLKNNGS